MKPKSEIIRRGSLLFRVFKQVRPRPSARPYESYTLSYRLNGRRQRVVRARRADLDLALQEAETAIANGQTDLLDFTSAKRARWNDLESRAAAVAATPEEIFALGLEAHAKNSRAKIVRKACPDFIEEYLAQRQVSPKWKRILGDMLERIAARFSGPLTVYTPREFEDWLATLKMGARSRKNYRDALQSLLTWARGKYVPLDFDPLQGLATPEIRTADVAPYSPESLAWWLNHAESTSAGRKIVPLICITAFAYVRHGEMNEEGKLGALDWRNVRFKSKRIYIPGHVAKKTTRASGDAREVDMPANLIAWLQEYAQPAGRICELANTSNALCRSRKKAAAAAADQAGKVANRGEAERLRAIARDLGHGQPAGSRRNALRKSCISYHKALSRNIAAVADAAGNSPSVIKRTYLHVDEDMRETAERWFRIVPDRADVLPLFAYHNGRA